MLARTLGLRDAVFVGLGSMLGAGVFAVWGPAAAAAGSWLLVALVLAAVVAVCNAWSSAVLAVRSPQAGGAYVYGQERLGELPGFLAGWCFVVGKTASCAAMAMTVAAYAVPGRERAAAVVAVVAALGLNLAGVHRSARVSGLVAVGVLAVLLGVAVAVLSGGGGDVAWSQAWPVAPGPTPYDLLQSAGLLFFAFAGYARIATLAEEVVDPARTIPRAVAVTVPMVLAVYAVVAVTVLAVLGPEATASSEAPLAAVGEWLGGGAVVWVLRVTAAAAAFAALLNLVLGVSRTALAMGRGGHLPGALATVGRRGVPLVAETVVAVAVVGVVLLADLRGAIGFSSFGVLLYYAVANASAFTLRTELPAARLVPMVGLVGCLALVVALPAASVVGGLVVLLLGLAWYAVRRRHTPPGRPTPPRG